MSTFSSLLAGGTSRREFLKRTAVAAAVASPALSIARSAHAQGKQEIRIGMIGSGERCCGAAAEAMNTGPDVKLAAICDVFPDRVARKRDFLRKRFPNQMIADDAHCFTGFDGYQKVIDSVDVVLIACASKFHPMYAEAAVKAGKHVFVEKPNAIDPVGVRRFQAACELAKQKDVCLLSGLMSRYENGFQETIKRIHDGAIGDIVAIQSMFLRGPYQTVRRDPKLTETQYQFSNWYHFLWLSGDDVTQSLVHNFDRASWALKEQMPKSCFGLGGRSSSYGEIYGDMFDHHTVVYDYPSGVKVYAMCRTQNNCYGNYNDYILGTKGQCDLGRCRIEGETKWRFPGKRLAPHQAEQTALFDAIRTGKKINSGSYAVNSTMAVVMGQLACYTGRSLTWDEVSKADFQFGPTPEQSTFDTPPPVKPDATGNYPLPQPGITAMLPPKK